MAESNSKAVFLSYASQDAGAARRLCDALRAVGVEVWFDVRELHSGDQWDAKIRGQIGDCALFLPVISANTQSRLEGYFRIEWNLAAQRTHAMAAARPFLLPVVIDATPDSEAHVPAEFKRVQWTRLPNGEAAATFVQRVQALLASGLVAGVTPSSGTQPAIALQKPGDRIGHYKLIEEIGEGGCGIVWMAEQDEPVRRRVAIKVIKLGMDTKEVIARFQAEQQALAMMDHPNIARVFEAGTTDLGRPFFAMELARGVKITDYCDRHNLGTSARLDLFVQVCHAIQHAHQKGIIHRDIKPSNILVTLHDGVPVPKVIDFGIAKATLGRLTDQTLYTTVEQFVGTPAYMSPEQAEMSGLDIDTRSDVYSLGVLLYELLTGRPPFDPQSLMNAGIDEVRRTIREVEPPRPSARLRTLTDADRATAARQRGMPPAQLTDLLGGDLDWIVMRCLEKDRMRRYESANALAADIARHLHNEPVVARPPSTAYLIQKLIRRHKAIVVAGAAVFVALLAGLAVSTWAFVQEKAARERAVAAEREQITQRKLAEAALVRAVAAETEQVKARALAESARNEEARQRALAEEARANEAKQRLAAEAEEKKAKTAAAKSEQAFNFMAKMLRGVGPSVAAGRDTALLREVLDKTVKRLEKNLKDQPEVEASLRTTLATVYLDLGDLAKGEALAREALALSEKVYGRKGEEVATALAVLGMSRMVLGHPEESEKLMREALELIRQLPGEQDDKIGGALYALAGALVGQGKLPEAEVTLRDALPIVKATDDPDENPPEGVIALLGRVLQLQGRLGEAEPMMREALALQKKRLGNDHPLVGYSMAALSNGLIAQGKFSEAETTLNEALAILKKSLGSEHPNIASLLPRRSEIAMGLGKLPEAETTLREAIALQTKVLGAEHPSIANTRALLSEVLQRMGKLGDAETQLREAQAAQQAQQKALGKADFAAAEAKVTAAVTAMRQGKWAEVESNLRAALPAVEQANGRSHPATIGCHIMLADAVYQQNRPAESETILRGLLTICRQAFGDKSTYVSNGLLRLGQSLEAQGKLAETEVSLREMLAIAKTFTTDGENASVADALLLLAAVRARLGDPADASRFAKDAAAMSRKLPENQRDNGLNRVEAMATRLQRQGKRSEEEIVQRTALEFLLARDGHDGLQLGQLLTSLADTLNQTGKYEEAVPFAREGWELRKKLRRATDWTVANARSVFGQSLLGAKKYAEAEAALTGAFADMQKNATDAVKQTSGWRARQRAVSASLVQFYDATNQPAKAAEWKQQQAVFSRATASANSSDAEITALNAQDEKLKKEGKLAEAEAVERKLLELTIARYGRTTVNTAGLFNRLAQTLNLLGKFSEAEPFAREGLAVREKFYEPGTWYVASSRSALGGSLAGQNKYAEAEPMLLRAATELQALLPDRDTEETRTRLTETATFLARLYEKTNQPEKAVEWQAKIR